ncbi:MAG: helix-turn-helix domain-containing protein [Prevotella sp.]|nr:helix-turn-helix domain-containing protein [Prevotella sp.]
MHKRLLKILAIACCQLLMVVHSIADDDKRFFVYNSAHGLADNSAQTISCTKTGRLVITTMGQINFYDGYKFSYIDPTTENIYTIPKYNGHAHVYFDKHHHLWFKKRNSLSCVDLMREMYVDNIAEEFQEFGMNDKVLDLFCDSENLLYLLTEKGIYSVERDKYFKVRTEHNLQEIDTFEDKYLLLFYEDGVLEVLELSTGEKKYSESAYDENKAKTYGFTTVILKHGSSFFQIRNGSKNGWPVALLLHFDISSWKWETVLETPYYLSNLKIHEGLLYIPSAYCYWTYDLSTKALKHIERLKMSDGSSLLTDINCIEFDKQGGMWLGTEKRGLLYARPYIIPFNAYRWEEKEALYYSKLLDKNTTPIYNYRDKNVNCVFRDSRGWDWVGTSTGLQLYSNESARLPQIVTRREGLLNNVVHCIQEDHAHNIWVACSYGVCCLIFDGDRIRYVNRYNQYDGIPSESFVNGRSMLLEDGTIVMQGLDHVLTFNPDRMATLKDSTKSDIYPKLIRLFVNGTDVRTGQKMGGNVILERAITRTKVINLNYNQNSLSLTFSGLNYFRPQQTFYRVRVTGPGLSDKWVVYTPYSSGGLVDSNGQLHLPLPSLVPGTYKIEVQTSMLPDEWHTTPYEWVININEPWWRTTGIFLLGLSLLGILLIVYLYMYLKNAGLKARRDNEEQSIIKRIKSFAERCDARSGMVLEPMPEEVSNHNISGIADFSKEFTDMMEVVMPALVVKKNKPITMRELSNMAGMKLPEFYQLITSNIYKNPRPVALQMMLSRAYELLKNDKAKDIAEISAECGFVSPNYFISQFYHKYHATPQEFRMKQI